MEEKGNFLKKNLCVDNWLLLKRVKNEIRLILQYMYLINPDEWFILKMKSRQNGSEIKIYTFFFL